MAFKARKVKKGLFEILGLESFIETKLSEIKKSLGVRDTRPVGKKVEKSKKVVPARALKTAAGPKAPDALDQIIEALESHPRRADLVKLGKEKDQLLRSLVPLYVAQKLKVEITSGVMSRFWRMHNVKYAAPNAAKALRNHVGYARATKLGRQITPNGVRYVEQALKGKLAKAA